MDDLLARVRTYAQRYRLFTPGQTVVVGVSGGADSLCLLHLLRRLAPELRLWLHVAHLHHGLRGAEADADAAFVAELADCWGMPCTVGRADVAALAREAGLSLEEAARQARYRFLTEVAEAGGATTIAVGHNADDQAETVLMHFLRGSGTAGLRGMLPRTPLEDYRLYQAVSDNGRDVKRYENLTAEGAEDAETPNLFSPLSAVNSQTADETDDSASSRLRVSASPRLHLVRPLLAIPRAGIEAYCAEYRLVPRFDRSNEDTTFFRNRLRYELLPLLETYNPGVRQVLAHTAEVLAGDHEVLRREVEEAWESLVISEGAEEVRFSLPAWRGLLLGLQRAVVREAIHRLRRSVRNINWEHIERAVWLAREGHTGQAATLAAGLELQIGYDALRIAGEGTSQPVDLPQVSEPVALAAPGVTELGAGWQVIVRRLRREEAPDDHRAGADPWAANLDAGAAGDTLILRPRAPGDRFSPLGLAGHSVKLNEFMIDAKIARDARSGWPLLVGRDGIVWVCGLRLSQPAAIDPDTDAVWRVRFVKPKPT
jgi:tRNA(Ile)-lysidine synthetase-like protein